MATLAHISWNRHGSSCAVCWLLHTEFRTVDPWPQRSAQRDGLYRMEKRSHLAKPAQKPSKLPQKN